MATALIPDDHAPEGGMDPHTRRRCSAVAIALHWLIAAAILLNIYLGWSMGRAQGMAKFTLFQTRKSVGMTVLALTLLRVLWRLTHRPPPYPATTAAWERVSAKALHALFYVLMVGMPLTGWGIVSASSLNLPTVLYGAVPFPRLGFVHDLPIDSRKAIEANVGTSHVLLAWLFAGLTVLHGAAALKHRFVRYGNVLASMFPWRPRRPAPPVANTPGTRLGGYN